MNSYIANGSKDEPNFIFKWKSYRTTRNKKKQKKTKREDLLFDKHEPH